MTERYNHLTVALERDMSADDAAAIGLLRGVLGVAPQGPEGGYWTAQLHARQDLEEKLWAALHPKRV